MSNQQQQQAPSIKEGTKLVSEYLKVFGDGLRPRRAGGLQWKAIPACGVCAEKVKNKDTLRLQRGLGGEHFSREVCGHLRGYCRGCVGSWATSQMQSGRHLVRCPHPDCKASLYKEDIRILVRSGHVERKVFSRWDQLKTIDYRQRLVEQAKSDPQFWKWIQETKATPCPSCGVLVSKHGGCSAVGCTCGHSFTWAETVFEAQWAKVKAAENKRKKEEIQAKRGDDRVDSRMAEAERMREMRREARRLEREEESRRDREWAALSRALAQSWRK
eukprot:CAMPEP_0170181642 /NCGR_PEP_ID=MMETSP0040_2-20121228/25648_1 /TAXON_ID=641309 /ORGANISM="Lotharella oceanica, Strain CCMP622" /LENGTH=272 /DNA_ID=CAMNT_0010426767 /DNA_START=83 /DNA_END=904 /DNA_ORIENTATION=+